ncbi:MAG: hypothetical protein SFW64_04475 [Alphaproteobacteria bacterium]|nr:hypothetical protein [Alphaproteobacteria bacterium]
MDDSDSRAETHDMPPAAAPSKGVARALLSAAVFGTLGALVGRYLGKHGNARNSDMAQPMMQWGMGIFGALLAAYCSFKASARGAGDEAEQAPPAAALNPEWAAAPFDNTPLRHAAQPDAQIAAVENHGTLQERALERAV